MLKLISCIYLVLVLCSLHLGASSAYVLPDVTIEVLKNGSFRAYIPDSESLNNLKFHARVNNPIAFFESGNLAVETDQKTGDFWIFSFPNANVKVGDRIYYWLHACVHRLCYKRDSLNTTITDLLDEYPSLKPRCVVAATIVDQKETCIGDIIFDEQFDAPVLEKHRWIVEQWIPTFTAPSFVFNSYVNKDKTRMVKDGILQLHPIAFKNDVDIRGILDLRDGCTSKIDSQCYYRSKSFLLLPPVQSAKITTKISFKYGKIEIRAKLPAGEWLVPVMQLEKKNKNGVEPSPFAWVAYSRGNEHLTLNGEDIGAHLVYGGPVPQQDDPNRTKQLPSKRSSDPYYAEFHIYSLEWKPGKMTLSIDDVEYGSVDLTKILVSNVDIRGSSPQEEECVISLGVSVGGLIDFPEGCISGNNPKPWSNDKPTFIKDFFDQRSVWFNTWTDEGAALHIDYVKVTAV